jgi:hypothetical protein
MRADWSARSGQKLNAGKSFNQYQQEGFPLQAAAATEILASLTNLVQNSSRLIVAEKSPGTWSLDQAPGLAHLNSLITTTDWLNSNLLSGRGESKTRQGH